MPLSLFKIKGLWEADVTQVLAMAGFYTMFFLVTLYMEEVLGYSAIHAGLCYLPVTVGAGLGAGAATKAIPRIGTRPLIVVGALLGGALGLAIFVSLATGRTNHLLATHTQPAEALTLGFQRGLLGASIALVIAAVIALRAPNVHVADMAPGADDDEAPPVPVAGYSTPEAPHFPTG